MCENLVWVIVVEHSVQPLSSLPIAGVGSALGQSKEFHLQAAKFCDRHSTHLAAHCLAALPTLVDEDDVGRYSCVRSGHQSRTVDLANLSPATCIV